MRAQQQQQQQAQPDDGGLEALLQSLIAQEEQAGAERYRAKSQEHYPGWGSVAMTGFNSAIAGRKEKKAIEAQKEAARLLADQQALAQGDKKRAAYAAIRQANPSMPEEEAMAYANAAVQGVVDAKEFVKPKDIPVEVQNRQARGDFLKQNPEIVARVGQSGADEFYLTGKMTAPKSGMSLLVGPDGSVMFSEGGDPVPVGMVQQFGKPAQNKVEATLMGAGDSLAALENIAEGADSKYLTTRGALEGVAGRVAGRAGMDSPKAQELQQFGADRRAWINQVGRRLMAYRKEITGTAGSEQELARIEQLLLNPDMGPQEFKRSMESEVDLIRQDANRARERLGLPAVEFEPYQFDYKDQKGKGAAPIDASGMTEEQIMSLPAGTEVIVNGQRMRVEE
jgi:hypothetical protein